MQTKEIIVVSIILGLSFLSAMALVTRILMHKHVKATTEDVQVADSNNEDQHQLAHISSAWKRLFASKSNPVRGRWVPTLSGMIKAGDEGLFPSALFANLHNQPGELSLQRLYEAFAEELRSRPMPERSTYPTEISRFLSSTKPVSDAPKRAQSMSFKGTSKGRANATLKHRKSLDLSAVEKGLVRSISIKKPAPTLVPMRSGLLNTTAEKPSRSAWMKEGQIAASRYGSLAITVTSAELAALSIMMGSPLIVDEKREYISAKRGALNISMSTSVTEDGKHQITLRQHKRSIAHLPAKGSGFSPLFAKHLAAGSLPFSQDKKTFHSILISTHTLKAVQSGSPLYLHDSSFKTPQTRFLNSLPSSRDLVFHIASSTTQSSSNTLLDAISALPFSGGLVPLTTTPVIKTVSFIAFAGLPPARLLQRLEALVDKVNMQAPYLSTFGPLHEHQYGAILLRERERLGRLAMDPSTPDSLADKAARVQRYVTLLERLMALVPDLKPNDVLAAVHEATKVELERAYADAVLAYHVNSSRSSSVVDSHGCPNSDARSKRLSTSSPSRSDRGSATSTATPGSSAFPVENLGKQVEQILKAELPFSVKQIASVARLVLAAWTLSVGNVAWEEGEEGFRVLDLEAWKGRGDCVLC
ncbi:hypothetical protein FB567DRAFT_521557 [Paraphoma chrysanthemicola]|uniref:Uncharacterized protein n=1 Tax=Paraphoma chrysanthemicola TaxID=798071 RepID=A0A8K0R9G7_9PLEO|nr:hypothetical protein FB567DRAFT_521557 [Paraphoma chrysanthemicola]